MHYLGVDTFLELSIRSVRHVGGQAEASSAEESNVRLSLAPSQSVACFKSTLQPDAEPSKARACVRSKCLQQLEQDSPQGNELPIPLIPVSRPVATAKEPYARPAGAAFEDQQTSSSCPGSHHGGVRITMQGM